MNALTLSGSIRKGSYNRLLQRDVSERLRRRGVAVTELDLADYPLPVFSEDIEVEGMPDAAVELGRLFVAADIVFIASPEYNAGLTPLLVNTLDWVSRQKGRPFRHAVFGLGGVSSGKLSTVVGLSHLRDMLTKVMALTAAIDIRVGPGEEAFDTQGQLIDETAITRAELLADELIRLAAK
ncbi:MAG: NAD(P)H-dependent oxidoreductase [Alphaproteobacteria bacterium]|nr:NAD(P)H-dependent oxidoreductase [Alphaproteobacteria bacterium]